MIDELYKQKGLVITQIEMLQNQLTKINGQIAESLYLEKGENKIDLNNNGKKNLSEKSLKK